MTKQTRKINFGKRSGLEVYPVSMGAMRFPEMDKAIPLIRQAIDAGMIYIDTSRGYGDSEIKLGKALKDGYREKVILSTKCSPWVFKVEETDDSSADCTYKRILESMQRLDVEYLDFYQVWNINNPENYEKATRKGGMVDGIRHAADEGLVGHIGFTTHDEPENISRYIDEAHWCEVILFTYNIFNQKYKDVVAKAHDKGIGTIIMNPACGGMLAENSPVIADAVKSAVGISDAVEAGHRYLKSDPNVDTIICGITKPEDIESTIANFEKPAFDTAQISAIEKAMNKLSPDNAKICTSCKYCMPCPAGIDIPAMMDVVFHDKVLKVPGIAKEKYDWLTGENNKNASKKPSECTACKECEAKCTQNIPIADEMQYLAHRAEQGWK
jgi:uncharacterized protein